MTDDDWLDTRVRRAPVARIFEVRDTMVLVHADGEGRQLHGQTAILARTVLDLLKTPHTGRELLSRVEALAGTPIDRPAVIGELLALLRTAGAVDAADRPTGPRTARPGPRVVLGITGAVASMHAPVLVQRLQTHGCRVRVAATRGAAGFVRLEALAALTHEPVTAAMWPEDGTLRVPHIDLARWADAVVVSPASATTISRIAGGDHSSIVAAIALATRAPVLVVPSMNDVMFTSAAVQRNLAQLAADGMHVATPAAGIEVADRPGARSLAIGAAPPAAVVVALLDAMLRRAGPSPRHEPEASDWDAAYRDHLPDTLPWHSDVPDPHLLAAVDRLAPSPATVVEVGTGLGTLAVALALRGHRVVATDVSSEALSQARARAAEAGDGVVWLRDDITASALQSRFDVAVDRGCLSALSEAGAAAYASTVARIVAPGGVLVLSLLEPEVAQARGVTGHTPASIEALLEESFELVDHAAATLTGAGGEASARVYTLRRRA